MENTMSIYEQLKQANIPLSSHESDLYALKTPESTAIIDKYGFKSNVRIFSNRVDHKLWYDIPFAYEPFWDNKKTR